MRKLSNYLNFDQKRYLNEISKVVLEIGEEYKKLFLQDAGRCEVGFNELERLIDTERKLYRGIPEEWLDSMISYVSKAQRENSLSVVDQVNNDYHSFIQDRNHDWFGIIQNALVSRVSDRLTKMKIGEVHLDDSFISSVEYLSKEKFLMLLNESASDFNFYQFVKYDLFIRDFFMENALLFGPLDAWRINSKNEFLDRLQSDQKESVLPFINTMVQEILDHLFRITDDQMEVLSSNKRDVAKLDVMLLRSYLMLLDEKNLHEMMAYSDHQFQYTADRSNHFKSKRLIKEAFGCYSSDRKKCFEDLTEEENS